MKKITTVLLLTIFIINLNFAQATFVPDDNFEQALIDLGYDSGTLDDYVPTANIETITTLDIGNKNINDLTGIQDLMALEELLCDNNNLTSINLSSNTSLTTLECNNNQLTILDLSSNTLLTNLECQNNLLATLELSPNTALINVNAYNNQLTTIDVSQNVLLESLQCHINQLTNLDVSQNTSLVELVCSENNLTNLNVNSNTLLTELTCSYNQISALNISQNTLLDDLKCNYNQLTSLNTSLNTALTRLSCRNNQITSIDISQNSLLDYLDCRTNQLTNLDVTQNALLTSIYCEDNLLTSLDLSQNGLLDAIYCHNNQLTSLDFSLNPALLYLRCMDNQLTNLNLKNGNNINLVTLMATGNPDLTCINVDDAAYSTANWTDIDPQTVFAENCIDNTTCLNAQIISVSSTINTVNFDLTNEYLSDETSCAGTVGTFADTWFEFTMPEDGSVGINGNINANLFSLYDSCGSTELACFNNSEIIENLTIGSTYKLRVFRTADNASNSNQTSFNIVLGSTLSIDDGLVTENTIKLYPNPVKDFLNISVQNNQNIDSIECYNLMGRQVFKKPFSSQIEVSNLKSGLYLLRIITNTGSLTKKIMVH